MGFFYQAIKRATGNVEEEKEVPVPASAPAVREAAPQHDGVAARRAAAATSAVAVAPEPAVPTMPAAASMPAPAVAAIPAPANYAPAAPVVRATAPASPVVSSRPALRHFEVQHPVENLVAFLTPPILEPNMIAMEQCRVLRTRLKDMASKQKLRTIMLTSVLPAEGKTLLSVNLAYALSQLEDTRVLLVDADLRRPSVGKFLK